jgi:hypothetical protein
MVVGDDGLWSLVVTLSERSSFRVWPLDLQWTAISSAVPSSTQWLSTGLGPLWLKTSFDYWLLYRHHFTTQGGMQQCLAASVWQQWKWKWRVIVRTYWIHVFLLIHKEQEHHHHH